MIALLLAACGHPYEAVGTGDSEATTPPVTMSCQSEETIMLDSGYGSKDTGVWTFTWAIDDAFVADGGVFEPTNAPTISVTCPPCATATLAVYPFSVALAKGEVMQPGEEIWRYNSVNLLCP